MRVLDLCTGSGCIAVSLAVLCPGIAVDASDISAQALKVAAENGRRHRVSVRFLESDLFDALEEQYDVVVSNPPYIPTGVINTLDEEVRVHEPYQALDGKEDGLCFYRNIIRQSGDHLKEGGALLFEIGYDQGEAVSGLMMSSGYQGVTVKKDLAGLDRIVYGIYSKDVSVKVLE